MVAADVRRRSGGDDQGPMTNQCSMAKSKRSDWRSSTGGHSNLVIRWSLVIGHWSFACPPPYVGGYRASTPIVALLLAIPLIASAQLDQAVPASDQAAAGQALAEKWRDAVPPENPFLDSSVNAAMVRVRHPIQHESCGLNAPAGQPAGEGGALRRGQASRPAGVGPNLRRATSGNHKRRQQQNKPSPA